MHSYTLENFRAGRTAEEALKDWDVPVNEHIELPKPGDELAQFIIRTFKT